MKKVKVAYVISNIDRWMAFEWIEEHFRNSHIQIDFYLLSNEKGYFYKYLKQKNQVVDWHFLAGKRQYLSIIPWLTRKFITNKYSVVHCHFLDASICGLIAAKLIAVPIRIYTRHHSTSHHEYAKKGVLYDRLCNFLSTKIVAISGVVQQTLIEKEQVSPEQIQLIYHGFKWDDLLQVSNERISSIKNKYDIPNKQIIGVVSRFIELKGIQYIIPAFAQYIKKHPDGVLVLANARGSYSSTIKELLKDIPESNYRLIPFEKDIYALFHCFDVFVHVPINPDIEAFGQIYIEALALGIPSIMTKSGIGNEILNSRNCLLVPYSDSEAIFNSLMKINKNGKYKNQFKEEGPKTVVKKFEILKMMASLKRLYLEFY